MKRVNQHTLCAGWLALVCASHLTRTLDSSHSFHLHASKKVHQVTELYKRMDDVYREACLLYGEDPYPKSDESGGTSQGFHNFFSYFQRFIWDWKVCMN